MDTRNIIHWLQTFQNLMCNLFPPVRLVRLSHLWIGLKNKFSIRSCIQSLNLHPKENQKQCCNTLGASLIH